jgi:predicted porin
MTTKRTLIAASVLLATGAAFAQSSVTLYGLADMNIASRKDAATGLRSTQVNSSGIYESRFGFKGSEDLGAGLKINFQLEQGFAMDTGGVSAGQAFSRQSWVGASGAFGEVKAGKTWTAFDDISGSTQAAKNSMFAPNSGVWLTTSYKDNPNNGLYYATPSFGGVSAAVSYGLGENKTAGVGAGSVVSVNIKYANGPVYAGIAQQIEKGTGGLEAIKYTRLNGSYDLGVAKLLASYGRVASGDKSTKEWQLGADVPLNAAWTVSGGIARSSGEITGYSPAANYIGKVVNVTAPGAADVERTGYGIAAFYTLSKRTMLYGGFQANTTKTPGTADADGNVVALGVLHQF